MSGTDSLPRVPDTAYRAHETAIIEDGAAIGTGTAAWHHVHIRDGARVGEQCVLGKNVFVDAGAVIGDRVKVQNNVSVYSGVSIADDVFVGPAAVFTNDRVPRAFNTAWSISPTFVEQGASIGANATVVCGTRIGSYAMVAAGATVTQDVAAHQLVAGTPARHHGWVCTCGQIVSRDSDRPSHLTCADCEEARR